jgi:hypothetical protein
MLCFFRSLIDFDLIEGHLISGPVESGSDRVRSGQFDFFLNQVGSSSGPSRLGGFLRLGGVLSSLIAISNIY